MPVHAFVDETKARHLIVVVTILAPRDLDGARSAMTSFRLQGQRRVHFHREGDSRRRAIIDAICRLPLDVDIYDACELTNPHSARPAALDRIVQDLAEQNAQRLVIEQDDSVLELDRRALYTATRRAGVDNTLTYEHMPAKLEPLLWISDAVAWCWSRDKTWRQRTRPVLRNVKGALNTAKPGSPTVRKAAGLTSERYCTTQR